MTDPARVAYRRYVIVGVIIPMVIALGAAALQLWWLPDLPGTPAVHWAGETPDSYGPSWLYPLMTIVLCGGMPILFWLFVSTAMHSGEWGPTLRFLGAMSLGLSAGLAVAFTWSVWSQRGLADATEADGIGISLVAGLVAAAATGVAGWFAEPPAPRAGSDE